jgi:small subunit ribosomal protein S16
MVRIRLRRQGAKHQATYRLVVAECRTPRDGRFIENIGYYNPRSEPEEMQVDVERARYWLSVGAQPSEAAKRLLAKAGVFGAGPSSG